VKPNETDTIKYVTYNYVRLHHPYIPRTPISINNM